MESPFRKTFDEDRIIVKELVEKLSYEEQKKQLLWDYLKYRDLYRKILLSCIIPFWFIFKTFAFFPTLLIEIHLDVFLRGLASFILIVQFIGGFIVGFKLQSVEAKYMVNERSLLAFIQLAFYEPYDYEEKLKSIIPMKRVFLYALFLELCIDFFFIIDLFV